MAGTAHKILTPAKVGMLVVASVVTFGAFLQILSTRGLDRAGNYMVFAVFDDVLGLEKKSPVQIAGIDVGHISDVQLFQDKAKVILTIYGDVDLYEDAGIEKIAISLLGDYKLAIEPGSSSRRKLVEGDEIKRVKSLSNTDAIIMEVRQMTESISKLVKGTEDQPAPLEMIVRDVQGSAAAARTVLEAVSQNIDDNADKLNRILANIDAFTGDLSSISQGKDREIDVFVKDAVAIAESLKRTTQSIERLVAGQKEEDVQESVQSLKSTLEKMNQSLEHMTNILRKVDEGQGTVGALVNDSSIHDGVEEAVEGINSVIGPIARMQTWINLRSEFQFRTGKAKNYVQLILAPKEDKYYIIEVVDDPRGASRTEIIDVASTSPEDGRNFVYRERRTTTVQDGLKFSFMFAKRFYWLALRFGIIEGTGGVGSNFFFFQDRLEFLVDVNEFSRDARNPRVKALALVELIPHIYIHGGVDDFFNPGTVDYFVGAGVRFTDDDLQTLLFTAGGAVSGSAGTQ